MSNTDSDETLTREMESESFLQGLKPVHNASEKPPRAVYSLRLSIEEAIEFDEAARERGMTLSDFLRSSARAAIETDRESALGEVRQKVRELTTALNKL